MATPVTNRERSRPSRIALTGYGSINALGVGVEVFAAALREGRCGIGDLTVFPTAGYRTSLAAEVRDLAVPRQLRRFARGASRTALLALIAADEAWRMADLGRVADAGVLVGTTTGGMPGGEEAFRAEYVDESGPAPLRDWLETPISATTDLLARAVASPG